MPRRVGFSKTLLTLEAISNHYIDVEASLRIYFSPVHPEFASRFFAYTQAQLTSIYLERIAEVDITSALTTLGALEAAFRIDYLQRCYLRKKDELSRALREIHRRKGSRVRLEDEILGKWKVHTIGAERIIGDLRGAFKFRNWLAHGRYWVPKHGQKYDYGTIYALANEVFQAFPLEGV
jgi:hypothetical protein